MKASTASIFIMMCSRNAMRQRIPAFLLLIVLIGIQPAMRTSAQETHSAIQPLPADTSQHGALGTMPIRSLADTNVVLLEYEEPSQVDYWRLSAVIGTAVSTLGASYLYLKDTWWLENTTEFHFDSGNDLRYANNIDKAAHFYGGIIAADLSYGALRWSGLTVEQSLWYGVVFGAFVQIAIETKDGFAPRWGFSLYDVGIGTLGSFYPVAQYYVEPLGEVDIKWSYWQRSNRYFENTHGGGAWNDDYINQTYWASTRLDNVIPNGWARVVPDWLAVAAGIGVDESLTGVYDNPDDPRYNPGKIELYLALDVDITQILPSDSPVWEAVKHYLNYIKFPAPAVRITPGVIWYGLYF